MSAEINGCNVYVKVKHKSFCVLLQFLFFFCWDQNIQGRFDCKRELCSYNNNVFNAIVLVCVCMPLKCI